MKRILIIGNGAAANSAAEAIRRYDPLTPLIMVARENVPEFSACALPDYLAGWVKRPQLFIKKPEDYLNLGIEMHWEQSVQRIDTESKTVITETEAINYDRLILATGSRAAVPPVQGTGLRGNFVVKEVADIDAIIAHGPQHVLIAGSGSIGIEMAQALQERGCIVSVVEQRGHIMPRIFDREPARRIEEILTSKGIRIYTRESVVAVEGDQRVERAITDQKAISCDTIIWSAGVKQNTELAEAAGIKVGGQGGIIVDTGMRTNIASIFACGDCVESYDMLTGKPTLSLLWTTAKAQGRVAGANSLGCELVFPGAINLVVEEIFGKCAVSMGVNEENLRRLNLEIFEGEEGQQYWRILVQDERIMGFQSLGITSGLGAIMGLMKNRMPLKNVMKIFSDGALMRRADWYLPARPFLEGLKNSHNPEDQQ